MLQLRGGGQRSEGSRPRERKGESAGVSQDLDGLSLLQRILLLLRNCSQQQKASLLTMKSRLVIKITI